MPLSWFTTYIPREYMIITVQTNSIDRRNRMK